MGDNERLFAMKSCLRLKRSLPQVGLEPRTTRSLGQHLTRDSESELVKHQADIRPPDFIRND